MCDTRVTTTRIDKIVYACGSIIARSSEVVLQETGSHLKNASRLHGKIDYPLISPLMVNESLHVIGRFVLRVNEDLPMLLFSSLKIHSR